MREEEAMISLYLAAAALVAGAALGVLGVVCLGIHREERDHSLASDVSSRTARGARRLNGVYTRGPLLSNAASHRQSAGPGPAPRLLRSSIPAPAGTPLPRKARS
jgi:hypothetical protein